jgi:hypothetical protein
LPLRRSRRRKASVNAVEMQTLYVPLMLREEGF